MKALNPILFYAVFMLLGIKVWAGSGVKVPKDFSGKVHLVAIGINDYQKILNAKFISAEKDVQSFLARLKSDTVFTEWDEYLFFSNAKKDKIIETMQEVSKKSNQNDLFIFFFAGLANFNGDLVLADSTFISASELFFASQNIICARQLFYMDASFGENFLAEFRDKLIKCSDENQISKSNRVIIASEGYSYETQEGGAVTLSYAKNSKLRIMDIFSDSNRTRTKFLNGLYGYTEGDKNKLELIFFSEKEFSWNPKNEAFTRSGNDNQSSSLEKSRIITKGETLCFIMGCSNFNQFNHLSNPVKDARALQEILASKYNTHIIYLENPTASEFRRKLLEIRNTYQFKEGSQFLFFAATHGAKDENGVGQMIFKDSYFDEDLLQNTYSLSGIKKAISQFNCTNSLMLVDICHSGTMFDDGSCIKPNAMEIPKNSPIFQSNDYQSPAFVNFLNQKTNIFIGSSSDQVATDGEGNHSPFAEVLIDFLKNNNLPVIDSYYLEKEIRENVMKKGSISIPIFCNYSCKDDGRFLFIRK
jgi:hypothetical protein